MAKTTQFRRFQEECRGRRADECWIWKGYKRNADGYGSAMVAVARGVAKIKYVHRLMYEQAYGPIPDGLTLDHLCRNRACANPSHLEAVTLGENASRGHRLRQPKTVCVNGHDLTGDGVLMRQIGRYLHRVCRECVKARNAERYRRRKVAEAMA